MLTRLSEGKQTTKDTEGFWMKHSICHMSQEDQARFESDAVMHLATRKRIAKEVTGVNGKSTALQLHS